MRHPEQQYLDLLAELLDKGVPKADRTGTGTRSLFGRQMRFNLANGFPLITTKKLYTRAIIHELLWFIAGDTNTKYLTDNKVTIWDEWADANGNLGPVYGKQWRSWATPDGRTIDQLSEVIEQIKTNPFSRRLIVSAWNPADIPDMALAPCHCLFQFQVIEQNGRKRLNLLLFQRSMDAFLGAVFNVCSYALLLEMVAQVTGCEAGDFVHMAGDVHLYDNHVEQARLQLTRTPKPWPRLRLNPDVRSIFDFKYEDIAIDGYEAWPSIKADVAV